MYIFLFMQTWFKRLQKNIETHLNLFHPYSLNLLMVIKIFKHIIEYLLKLLSLYLLCISDVVHFHLVIDLAILPANTIAKSYSRSSRVYLSGPVEFESLCQLSLRLSDEWYT